MLSLRLLPLLGFAALFQPAAAQAKAIPVRFSNDENTYRLTETKIKTSSGEALSLGHKVTLHFFIAGLYVSDDGYVLLPPQSNRYYRLSPADIERYQAAGLLPKQLPSYSIPIFDLIFGYSLWIVAAFTGLWVAFESYRAKRLHRAAAPGMPATA